ncbi:MAG: hypothetical protein M3N37_10075 [Actinomycetota bacterium]|nr:hypothetical protein [Actinomycetota bacterium]
MKGVKVLALVGVVVVVCLIAGAYAAGRETPRLSAAEAQVFAQQALIDSGAREVELRGEPRAEDFAPPPEEGQPRRDPVSVWIVPLTVSDQPIELYVTQTGGRAAYLDDALPDGGFVLNEEQFDRLERFRLDLAGDRVRDERRGPSLVAGLLIALVAAALLASVLTGKARAARTDEA